MKYVKGFILSLLTLVVFLVSLLILVNLSLNLTVFSAGFFNKVYEANNLTPTITAFANNKIRDLGPNNETPGDEAPGTPNPNQPPQVGETILKYLDPGWLEREAPVLIKGVQAFLVGDEEKLPTINIKPIKDSFMNGLAEEMMQRPEVKKSLVYVRALITLLDSKYKADLASGNDEALVKKLKKERVVRSLGVDDTLLMKVISVYREKGLVEDLEKQIIIDVFADEFKLEKMQDTLDLDLFLNNIYADRQHPLAGFRNLISAYNTYSFAVLSVILAALSGMIFTVSFNLKKFLAWTGGGLTAAGVITAAAGLCGLFLPFVQSLPSKAVMKIETDSSPLLGDLAAKLLESFLDGYFKTQLLLGILVAGLIVGGYYLARYYESRRRNGSPETSGHEEPASINQNTLQTKVLRQVLTAFGRVLAVLVLLLAIWQSSVWGINNVKGEFESLNATVSSNPMKAADFNIFEHLSETTGLESPDNK